MDIRLDNRSLSARGQIRSNSSRHNMRLCGFDAVTTDRIRLSINKFRDDAVPANIKSLKLYNEPKRNAEGFEVSAYQRLDGDVPTEILAKGDEYVRNHAKFYDVYIA